MTFPGAPKLTKGAIVGIDKFNPLASVVIFQYNPKTMTRRLEATTPSTDGGRAEVLRLSGPPAETINLQIELDAADQLETGDAIAQSMGLYPQLSALEMLLYPKSAVVITNAVLQAAGVIEMVAPEAPFTLFVWGIKRVVPVRLESFSITEEEYDPALNPLRAKVDLGMRVLNVNDFSVTHPGWAVFLAHQVAKEVMATIGSVGNLSGQIAAGLG